MHCTSKVFALTIIAAANAGVAHAQVQFNVSFNATAAGLTATERQALTAHVQAAGAAWMTNLEITGARAIEVDIGLLDSRPTANGGSATSGFISNTAGRDLFEQGLATELRTGVDPNGASADVLFTFNTTYLRNELWFDPNPTQRTDVVPNNRTDAQSVLLHEFGHALAYNGWADLNTGIAPVTFWSTFDRHITPRPSAVSLNYFDGPNALLAFGGRPDLTTGNLFHWANSALAPNHGEPISMNLDEASQVKQTSSTAALIDELMNGVVFFRGSRYRISILDRAVLTDAGLNTKLFYSGFE
jgi:hypothetical protein